MININFPEDPSSLVFLAAPSANFVYVLARAVEHYGADNLQVADITGVLYGAFNPHRAKQQSVDNIVSALNIPVVRRVTVPQSLGLGLSPLDSLKAIKTAEEVLREVASDDDIALDPLTTLTAVSLFHAYGIVDEYLMPQRSDLMVVLPILDGEKAQADMQLETIISARNDIWNPLSGVSADQLFSSIETEGYLSLLNAIHHCIHDRPVPCGSCSGCMTYKRRLLESGLL